MARPSADAADPPEVNVMRQKLVDAGGGVRIAHASAFDDKRDVLGDHGWR